MVARQVLLCADEPRESLILSAISASSRAYLTSSLALLRFLERHDAAAAVVEAAFVSPAAEAVLRSRKRRGVPWPCIQIVRSGDNPQKLRLAWAAGAIRLNDCRVRLVAEVRRALIPWHLAAAVDAFWERFGTATTVATIFECVFMADPALLNVKGFVAAAAVSRSDLFERWRRTVSPLVDCGEAFWECCYDLADNLSQAGSAGRSGPGFLNR